MKTESPEDLPFFRHGRDPECDPEIAHTIVELIEQVEWKFRNKDGYWERQAEISDRKCAPNYRAKVDLTKLDEAWSLLESKTWLSLETGGLEKKVADLTPLQGLTSIETLILSGQTVRDIGVLAGLPNLKELHLRDNEVADIAPLGACQRLEELDLAGNPVSDFRILERLPSLVELRLSSDQSKRFGQCGPLPNLRKLDVRERGRMPLPRWLSWALPGLRTLGIVGAGKAPAIGTLPELPELRFLNMGGVTSLSGIERYSRLENVNLTGQRGYSLEPLAKLACLTCADLYAYSGELDASPLAHCQALRSLSLRPDTLLGLDALIGRLKYLHRLEIDEGRSYFDNNDAQALRACVTPWDVEFLAETPQLKPNLELQIVSLAEFERLHFTLRGINPRQVGDGLLWHENDWLLTCIESALAEWLQKKKDFEFPSNAPLRSRSATLLINSLKAYRSFRQIVPVLQSHLCAAKHLWVLAVQSELAQGPDRHRLPPEAKEFVAWVYPNKIVTIREHAYSETVQRLLKL